MLGDLPVWAVWAVGYALGMAGTGAWICYLVEPQDRHRHFLARAAGAASVWPIFLLGTLGAALLDLVTDLRGSK